MNRDDGKLFLEAYAARLASDPEFQKWLGDVEDTTRRLESHADFAKQQAAADEAESATFAMMGPIKVWFDALDRWWIAECEDSPGVMAQGWTPLEAFYNVTGAYLESLSAS